MSVSRGPRSSSPLLYAMSCAPPVMSVIMCECNHELHKVKSMDWRRMIPSCAGVLPHSDGMPLADKRRPRA